MPVSQLVFPFFIMFGGRPMSVCRKTMLIGRFPVRVVHVSSHGIVAQQFDRSQESLAQLLPLFAKESPPAGRGQRRASVACGRRRSLRSNWFTSVMIFAYARVEAANPVGGTTSAVS